MERRRFQILISVIGCSAAVFVLLLCVHATALPWLRVVLLTAAAIGLEMRWLIDRKAQFLLPIERMAKQMVDRLSEILTFVGVGLVAGQTRGLPLGLIAIIGCLISAYVRALGQALHIPTRPNCLMGLAARTHLLAAACIGGCVVAVVSRGLHLWMQGALVIICVGLVLMIGQQLKVPTTPNAAE